MLGAHTQKFVLEVNFDRRFFNKIVIKCDLAGDKLDGKNLQAHDESGTGRLQVWLLGKVITELNSYASGRHQREKITCI